MDSNAFYLSRNERNSSRNTSLGSYPLSNYETRGSLSSAGSAGGRRKTNKIVLSQSLSSNSSRVKETDATGQERWQEVERSNWLERDAQKYEWFDTERTPEVNFIEPEISSRRIVEGEAGEFELDPRISSLIGDDKILLLTSNKVQSSPIVKWSGVDAVSTTDKSQHGKDIRHHRGSTTFREGTKQIQTEESVWMVAPKAATSIAPFLASQLTRISNSSNSISKPASRRIFNIPSKMRNSTLRTTHHNHNHFTPSYISNYQKNDQMVNDEYLERKDYRRCVNRNLIRNEALSPEDYKEALAKDEIEELITPKNAAGLKSRRGLPGQDEEYKPVEFSLPIGPVFSFVSAEILTPSGIKERPKVIDNHDGSVGIVYTPHEEGLHRLMVDYNDKPINGSPFEFFVASQRSGLVTANGPGLSHGISGEECNFTVVTKDAGNGGLSVSIEGPSKADMNCEDNGDGTCSISYLPTSPGLYKVNVLFDDQHIVGSPFNAKISPSEKDARKSETALGRSSEIPLKLQETDLSSLTATITYPSGKIMPCSIKRLDDGQIGIGFTPTEVGVYMVEVLKHGQPVPNSPFKITVSEEEIANAAKVKAYGRGLKHGRANEVNCFSINTKDAGYGGLSLSVEGPSKAELECSEASDGICDVKYKPSEAGNYVFNVKFADEHIPGSPFLVKVDGGVMSEEVSRQSRAADQLDVGSQCELSLTMPATRKEDLEATVMSPSGRVERCELEEAEDNQFNIAFVPRELGVHTVSVKHRHIHIPGSPFQFTVGPILGGGAHKVKAVGPGLERAVVDEPAQFNVYTREAGAGCLSIAMEGPSKADINFSNAKDGSCLVSYTCDTPGDYLVYLKYNEKNIPDSPFRVYVSPSELQRRLNISELQQLGCQLNQPAAFTVDMRGGKGGLDAYIVAPSGAQSEAIIEDVKDDVCTIRFVPRENGLHKIFVRQDGVPLVGSPFSVLVGNVEADPSLVRVYGDGLHKGRTGEPAKFIVDTTRAGSGALAVTVDGPSKVQLNCREVADGYEFSYLPSAPGDYLISVKYGGSSHVPGSPFKATVTGSGKAGTWNEQSRVVVETVTKSSTTQKYSAPEALYDSDATKVQSHGTGLERASANKDATFMVDTSRAGHNMLLVGVMGPELPCEEISVKHSGDGQYTVVYRPGERGEYVLVVKWGEQHIPGSPFHIVVQ